MVQMWHRASASLAEVEASRNERDLARHLCAINSASDVDQLLSALLDAARQFGSASGAALLTPDEIGTEWRVTRRFGVGAAPPATSFYLDPDLARQISASDLTELRRGEPDDPFQPLWQACSSDASSMLVAPLRISQALIGILIVEISYGRIRPPRPQMLRLVVQQASVAAQRIRQIDRMSRVVDELLALQQVSDERCGALQRTLDVHDQLIKMLLEGQGLDSIVSALGRILANPIAVEDQFGNLTSYYLCGDDQACSTTHQRVVEVRPRGLRDHPDAESLRARLRELQRPLSMPAAPASGFFERRVVAPVVVGLETLGYISVLERGRALDELDFSALERAAVVVALHMMKEKTAAETRYKLRGDLIAELIGGRYGSDEEMIKRAAYLGVDLTKPWAVLLVAIDKPPRDNAHDAPNVAFWSTESRVLSVVERACIAAETEAVVSTAYRQIVVLARVRPDLPDLRRTILTKLGDRLRGEVAFYFPNLTASVGIGDCCDTLAQYRESYQNALRAIDVIHASRQVNQTLAFDQLGIYDVLSDPHNHERLARFVRDSIGPLLEYDQKHGTELVRTLEEFLTHDCHFVPTANALQLHTSTLRYRLERIEQLGVAVRGMSAKCNLQLALKVLRVTRSSGG